MGIYKFSQYFETKAIASVERSLQVIVVDGNLFWERLVGVHKNVESEREFHVLFFEYIFKTLLQQQLYKSTCQLERIEIAFDNELARNFLKMWKCIQRAETAQKNAAATGGAVTRFYINHDRVRLFWQDYLREIYPIEFKCDVFLSADELDKIVKLEFARYDTDDYVFGASAFADLKRDSPAVFKFVTAGSGGGESEAVSPGAVFSGDSDFLSRFASCRAADGVCVMDFENISLVSKSIIHSVVLCNARLAYDNHKQIVEILAICRETLATVPEARRERLAWLTEDLLVGFCVRCLAMTSQNDYITCSFYCTKALRTALYQSVVFALADPTGGWSTFSLCAALTYLGECFRNEAASASRLKFFLQNMLRIFIFDFDEELAAKFNTYTDAAEHIDQCTDLEALCNNFILTQYEFLSESNKLRQTDTLVINTFPTFFTTLRNRLLVIEKKRVRTLLEENFKTYAKRLVQKKQRYAISSVLRDWIAMRANYKARNCYESVNEQTRDVDLSNFKYHTSIGNLFCLCTMLGLFGLARIWFGYEAVEVSSASSGYKLAVYRMVQAVFDTVVAPFGCVPDEDPLDKETHHIFVKAARTTTTSDTAEKQPPLKKRKCEDRAVSREDLGLLPNFFTLKQAVIFGEEFASEIFVTKK